MNGKPLRDAEDRAELVKEVRRAKVWALYMQRKSTYQIARELGMAQKTVWRDVKACLATWKRTTDEEAEEILTRELAELDEVEANEAAIAMNPELSPATRTAADMARLKCKDHRAKLVGLYAAQRIEVGGKGGGAISITDARLALAEALAKIPDPGATADPDGDPSGGDSERPRD